MSAEDHPSKTDKGRAESERDGYERDLDQHIAAAHRASADTNIALEKLVKTRVAHWPPRIVGTEGCGEEKQREKKSQKTGSQ